MLVVHNTAILLSMTLRKYILQSVFHKHPMGWVGHVACMGDRRGIFRGLVGKPEGKRPLGKPRHRWEDNIEMDLQDVRCGGYGLDQAGSG
jgi:hypothetical protein